MGHRRPSHEAAAVERFMPELPGGTLTVLHTDIENSTSLTRHLREQ